MITTGTFIERTNQLSRMVGRGELTGKIDMPLPYSAPQHESHWKTGPLAGVSIRKHPGGGGGKYLSRPLYGQAPQFMRRLASATLDGRLVVEMIAIQRQLAGDVYRLAPRKSGRLRASAIPQVFDNGRLIFRGA